MEFTHPPMKKCSMGLISLLLIAKLTITVSVSDYAPTSTEVNKPGADVFGAPQKYWHPSQGDSDSVEKMTNTR